MSDWHFFDASHAKFLGIINFRMIAMAPVYGVTWRRIAQLTRKGDLLAIIDHLVAKKHHLPAVERSLDVSDLMVGQRFGKVHAMNFRTNVDGQRPDVDARKTRILVMPDILDFGGHGAILAAGQTLCFPSQVSAEAVYGFLELTCDSFGAAALSTNVFVS